MPITLVQEMVRQLAEWLTAHRDHPALDDGPSLVSTDGPHEGLRACLDYARWAVEAVLDEEDPHVAALCKPGPPSRGPAWLWRATHPLEG